MAVDVYALPAVAQARATLDKYRAKIESGVGQAQTLVEVGGSAYLAARLSAHLGGPEGKTILGVPLELAIGAACGALAMSGSAGRHAEDVLAAGVGAIAAYTARLGFQAGMATAKPPAEIPANAGAVQGMVGALPAVVIQPQMMLPAAPSAYAQQTVPYVVLSQPVQQAASAPVQVMPSSYEEVIGDEIDSAAIVLDQINRR